MSIDTTPSFFDVFIRTILTCLEGLPLTLYLTLSAVITGLIVSIPLAILHSKRHTLSARLIGFFTYLFTGTPLLVQIYVFYYGFPEFGWVQYLMTIEAFNFLKDAYAWMWLALSLNTIAYLIVIFSGAIRNTDNGEVEAGRAYGMSSRQVMRHIILPSSLRRALPAYSNEVICILQATSLASVITLYEIMGKASTVYSATYRSFPVFVAAAVVYLVLTFILVCGFRLLEKRYLTHLKPRSH